MVDGDTGLGQAWCRWLSPAGKRNKRDNGEPPGQGVAECSAQSHEVGNRDANATAELTSDRELFEDVADVADVAHTEEAPGLGPRQHANNERRPPADDSETTEAWFARLRHKLLGDLDAQHRQTNGSEKPRESERKRR
jgi:hypothetical protein